MLAQSAIHESPGAAAAAGAPDGARANNKKKKLSPFAALFSNILSQAQHNLLTKATEAEKAQASHKAQGKGPILATAGLKKDPGAVDGARGRAQVLAASKHSKESAGSHAVEDAVARKKSERPQGQGAEDFAGVDPGRARAFDEGRRTRVAKDSATDEITSVRASRAALQSHASDSTIAGASPKAKGAREEADTSIEEKKRDRAQSNTKLSLLDLRRSVESRREASAKAEPKADEAVSKEAIREVKPSAQGHELVRDLSLQPSQSGDAHAFGKTDSAPSATAGQDFQAMLAERMRDAWNGEIVKSAHIVLREGDAGTIRLRLRPESLGNVKIELNLSDNNIRGKILVESDEAKTAFERNMSQLADAFMQGGFDSARLEVAVGGGSGNGASGNGSGEESRPFYSERLRSVVGSSADPSVAASAYARRGGAIDILA